MQLLYGLCPTAIAILITLLVYGRVVVADATTIDAWWAKMYRDFRSFIPQNIYSIDPFFYQPLEWVRHITITITIGFRLSFTFTSQSRLVWLFSQDVSPLDVPIRDGSAHWSS